MSKRHAEWENCKGHIFESDDSPNFPLLISDVACVKCCLPAMRDNSTREIFYFIEGKRFTIRAALAEARKVMPAPSKLTKAEEIGRSLRGQVYWRTCSKCGDVDRDSLEAALIHAAELALEWDAKQCEHVCDCDDGCGSPAKRIRAGKKQAMTKD